jgi:ATP-dependent helicase/nuclease subunit A
MSLAPFTTDGRDPQSIAADPAISAFVTANAGSGKTKTLIDRVARLLLGGARPASILCVTYTKAAAAEMQRRLFARLGHWAVLEDGKLRAELAALQGGAPESFDAEALSRARALFASALETPGGLKIQTIHAFCEALLRRFPMEAGISPGFSVMDDVQAADIAKTARTFVAEYAENDGPIGMAYARLSVALDFASFQSMFAAFEARRGPLDAYFKRCGGAVGIPADVWKRCGFDTVSSAEAVGAAVMARLPRPLLIEAAQVLANGGATDIKCAANLRAAAQPGADFGDALSAFFTAGGEGTPATWVAKTSGLKSREDLRPPLLDLQSDLEMQRDRVRGAHVAEDTVLALTLASAYVAAYQAEKAQRSALDFADLIAKVAELLTERSDAAWVLYKLDGGIDHLLLDEAQDTAPEQWDIIRALTDEFFAGAGSRLDPKPRTLFVVGDEKQSIYSFQGADPARFLAETVGYLERIVAAGALAEPVPLLTSYRSTPEILDFVDAAFDLDDYRAAVPPPIGQDKVVHAAHRTDGPGCVDLWPLIHEVKGEDRGAWDAPLDEEPTQSANRRLAMRIAAEVVALVKRGDAVFDNGRKRPAGYGDVLVLVRRRGVLFEEILRALKVAGAPVAGADRLRLSEHIVFDDLMALGRFCLYPDDDLTLAALLKSPFIGLDDDGAGDSLYALAYGREKTSLWQTLNARAGEQSLWREGLDFLTWARAQASAAPPFELFSKALDRIGGDGRSMRVRFLTRLGAEAQDALAEFLGQTAAAEQRGVRDLESLTAAFRALEMVVKREMDAGRGEVRVMTAHGAKGLEAPIVILPEIAYPGGGRGSPLLTTTDGDFPGFLWCSSKTGDCDASKLAREAREQRDAAEALRLLYVALTRARDRLILCGRVAADAKEENVKGWYHAIRIGLAHEAVAHKVRASASDGVAFERFGADPVALGPAAVVTAHAVVLPAWTQQPPAPEPPATRYASPSTAWEDGAAVAPSPLAGAANLGRYRRGEIIHRLLQVLPDVAPSERRGAATRLLAAQAELTDAQRDEMAAAAFGVLDDPVFAEVFAPGSRPEVAIAGAAPQLPADLRISGRVDRLFVGPMRVLVADFKTNRPAPRRIEEADPAYVLQMALYWAVLQALFPDRKVEAALVWTDGPKLMTIPEELLAASLVRLGQAVDR